jgi:hypothetical protein
MVVPLWIPRLSGPSADAPHEAEGSTASTHSTGHDLPIPSLSECAGGQGVLTREALDAGLLAAARRGHVLCVAAFLAAGANPNGPEFHEETAVVDDTTPLMALTSFDHTDAVRKLLDAGANPNLQRRGDGYTVTHIAALRGNSALIEILSRRGARFDRQSVPGGETPLHLAASLGHTESVRAICRLPESPEFAWVPDAFGRPPARRAATRAIVSIIEQACGKPSPRWRDETLTQHTQILLTGVHRVSSPNHSNAPEAWEFRLCLSDEPNCPLLFHLPFQTYSVRPAAGPVLPGAPNRFDKKSAVVRVAPSEILHIKIVGIDRTGRRAEFGEWFGRSCFENKLLESHLRVYADAKDHAETGLPHNHPGQFVFVFSCRPL